MKIFHNTLLFLLTCSCIFRSTVKDTVENKKAINEFFLKKPSEKLGKKMKSDIEKEIERIDEINTNSPIEKSYEKIQTPGVVIQTVRIVRKTVTNFSRPTVTFAVKQKLTETFTNDFVNKETVFSTHTIASVISLDSTITSFNPADVHTSTNVKFRTVTNMKVHRRHIYLK